MRYILSQITDVYFHLAAEDYFLHECDDEIFMLWRGDDAVVCGKHQNICAEADYAWCRKNNISLARRLTGGGTVFHDSGNVNFTFIQNASQGLEHAVDYRRFLEPLRTALKAIGVETTYSLRNDLMIGDYKVSGNAEHVLQRRKRVLHHGTLLFDSKLENLGRALKSRGRYESKAVQSVRSEVTNISAHFGGFENVHDFMGKLMQAYSNTKHTNWYVFSSNDIEAIGKLKQEKYENPSWILGYSPSYSMEKEWTGPEGAKNIVLKVAQGRVEALKIVNGNGEEVMQTFSETMRGKEWNEDILQAVYLDSGFEWNEEKIWEMF